MKMQIRKYVLIGTILLLTLFICPTLIVAVDETPTPTPIVTDTPTPTATNTPVPTSTSAPTPSPTSTPTLVATNTPAPTPTSSVCSDQTPGSTPILVSATALSKNQIKLTWSESSSPVTYYLLSYGNAPGKYLYGNPNIGSKGTSSYTVGNLASGSTYYFVIKAVNGCTHGNYSNELSGTTLGGKPSPTPTKSVLGNSIDESDKTKSETSETPTPIITVIPTPTVSPIISKRGNTALRDLFVMIILFAVILGGTGIGYVLWMKKSKQKISKRRENNTS